MPGGFPDRPDVDRRVLKSTERTWQRGAGLDTSHPVTFTNDTTASIDAALTAAAT